MTLLKQPLHPQAETFISWTSCNLRQATRAERKPRGGAPGRLFAEKAGAAACGATRSITELAREHPARRPGAAAAAAGGFLAPQNTLCGRQERLGLVGEHPEEEPALPHAEPANTCFVHSRQPREPGELGHLSKSSGGKEKARTSHFSKTGVLFLQIAESPSRGHEGQARMSKNG